ncbi:unnamed protein product [Caenorhabditis bovis]|uniref:Uncharacterized protein n=1 Tax=Caenorhabditis bovis TaxID=2654633 RepID=A0A8S1E8U3_9PELO|nr:unnamed protein product [Caenorhabditis bovis]
MAEPGKFLSASEQIIEIYRNSEDDMVKSRNFSGLLYLFNGNIQKTKEIHENMLKTQEKIIRTCRERLKTEDPAVCQQRYIKEAEQSVAEAIEKIEQLSSNTKKIYEANTTTIQNAIISLESKRQITIINANVLQNQLE